MPNYTDIFLMAILAGAIASFSIFGVMYWHFHSLFKDYFYNKDHYVQSVLVRRLYAELEALKSQVKHMNLDHYENVVEDEYK